MFTPKEVMMRGIANLISALLIVLAGGAPSLAQTARIAVGAASGRICRGGWLWKEAIFHARDCILS